ncbi:MAG: malectin domain-containing carbohydrate-binding protein [Pseudomonadota bacterium]
MIQGDAKQWHKLTLEFEGPSLNESPETFMDYRLDVTFTHTDGTQIKVPGYFAADGDAANTGAVSGTIWKAHFNPPKTGDWTWEVSFKSGDGVAIQSSGGASAGYFDGQSGAFSIAGSDKTGLDLRGKGTLEYDGDQYLNFAGTGEVFLKSGVGSPENFLGYSGFDSTPGTHDYSPHLNDFNSGDPTWAGGEGKGIIGAVNYLAEHSVNSAYMMLMNIGGDGRDVSPWADETLYNIKKNPGFVDLEERAQVFDVSKLDQWEIVFEHMQQKGVTLHLFLQETENDHLLNDGDLGPERMLFMREMVARFGHHNGLIWNLGEENTNSTQQITDHSAYLKSLDPYDHAVTLHTYPGQHDKYTDYEGTETLDALSFQTSGDTQVPNLDKYLGGAEDAGRPVVAFLDEPGNAGTGLAAEGDNGWQQNHANMRETLWKFYAEGGSGAEWYFGYGTANGQGGDLKMEDFALRESAYEWAASAREFFEKLPLEDMDDGDSLTSGTKTHGLASDGEIYGYFLPSGGAPKLDLTEQTGTYKIGWYDVTEGGDFAQGSVDTVTGGGVRSLGSAPHSTNSEWAVMVWNTDHYDFPVSDSGEDSSDDVPDAPPEAPDVPPSEAPEVTLRIVDTGSDTTLQTLSSGETLDASLIGAKNLSIVADVSAPVGSVRLTLGDYSAVENVVPYALFGDTNGDFKAPGFAPFSEAGDYTLKIELFENANANGKISEITTGFSLDAAPADDPGSNPDTDPSDDPVAPPVSGAPRWLAENGTIVIEAENGRQSDTDDPKNDNWKLSDSVAGHSGEGYLHWDGANHYSSPGAGALYYEIEITEAGWYELGALGSRPKNGEANDLNNDFFFRMDGGQWKKVYFHGSREEWNWGTKFDVNHKHSTAEYYLEPGIHRLEVSGRSEDAYLDKIHLSLGSLNRDASLPETLAGETIDDTPNPNTAPEALITTVELDEDTEIRLTVDDIAQDAEGDDMTMRIVEAPNSGALTLKDGILEYTPSANASGTEAAKIEVSDSSGAKTVVAIDFVTKPINDAPEAVNDDVGDVSAGNAFVLSDLLDNDRDVDGDPLSIIGVNAMTDDFFENLNIDSSGHVSGILSEGARGTGLFEYTVSDGAGATSTASVSVNALDVEEPVDDEPDTPVSETDLVRAINIGSKSVFTAADGTVFEADDTGVGKQYAAKGAVSGTQDDKIYATEAWDPNGLSYEFAVANGVYEIDLHFAEIWAPAFNDGVRVFDIEIEDEAVVEDMDIYQTAGARTAHVVTSQLTVEDGVLDIDLLKDTQNPKLSALEIRAINQEDSAPPSEEPGPEETPPEDTPEQSGSSLFLVDTETDETLLTLAERTVLHQSFADGKSLSVAAEIDEEILPVESAKLSLDGTYVRTENVEPYALFGDIERDFFGRMDLADHREHIVEIDFFSGDKGTGEQVAQDEAALVLGQSVMNGVSNVEDLFAFIPSLLGDARIVGFEVGDRISTGEDTDDTQALLSNGIVQGDDLLIDFGAGNTLLLEDLARKQMEMEMNQQEEAGEALV